MVKRHTLTYPPQFSACLAIVCSVAFVLASNYCNIEALAGDGAHHETTGEHHNENAPASGHDEATVCCDALQAVLASKLDVRLCPVTSWLSHPLALKSLRPDALLVEAAHLATGLSPPTREPTPRTPFYRTTFASHAPPVRLA